jgi:hypothetical protein
MRFLGRTNDSGERQRIRDVLESGGIPVFEQQGRLDNWLEISRSQMLQCKPEGSERALGEPRIGVGSVIRAIDVCGRPQDKECAGRAGRSSRTKAEPGVSDESGPTAPIELHGSVENGV